MCLSHNMYATLQVQNPTLACVPATVNDYTRVFCLSSRNWSVNDVPSGAASLTHETGAVTYVLTLTRTLTLTLTLTLTRTLRH